MAQRSLIKRGQVWWVDFGQPRGSEPAYRHPALVIQRDEVNRSKLATVVVCVLTSNKALAKAPGNTLLPKRATGLPRDSVANASQIATVNKEDLVEVAGTVPPSLLRTVSAGLRWFLAIEE
ncbi:MAG TPA: type II toxin-antitoxin system PemK/MazF family toxin [Polyangiaceae bacterium]|nr:type II toxin-antitoxin system PemK/MazF family toxin [Polyangiaceae bacterium]